MSYSCSAAVSFKIDHTESQDLTLKQKQTLQESIDFMRGNAWKMKKDYVDTSFFTGLTYFTSFYRNNEEGITQHDLLETIVLYKGEFKLETYLLQHDNYVESPEVVLELLFFTFYISKKIPKSEIYLGLGDVAYFWMDLKLCNGEIVEFISESDNDSDEETWGFKCSESEIRQFIVALNCLWMEDVDMDVQEIEEYYELHNTWEFNESETDASSQMSVDAYLSNCSEEEIEEVIKYLSDSGYLSKLNFIPQTEIDEAIVKIQKAQIQLTLEEENYIKQIANRMIE
jgi:hypothetical protein